MDSEDDSCHSYSDEPDSLSFRGIAQQAPPVDETVRSGTNDDVILEEQWRHITTEDVLKAPDMSRCYSTSNFNATSTHRHVEPV